MKNFFFALLMVLPFAISSCNKCHDRYYGEEGLVGDWRREQTYANDHWGGAFYWHEAEDGTGVRFTEDGKYYRNEAKAGMVLIGTYKVTGTGLVEITATGASAPTQSFRYELDNMWDKITLGYDNTEGVQKEKFYRKR